MKRPIATEMTMWNLDRALVVLRQLQNPLKEIGYAIGLTGSVLLEGLSLNDLDVIVYPLNKNNVAPGLVREVLQKAGWELCSDNARVLRVWRKHGSTDTKFVEVWQYDKKRIDVFYLS